tara:strand:+ start:34 stop:1371 length:1338 start_codon:yes stop_codon:yes gene_type:complete
MSKPTVIVSCPADTYSGYGGRSRDLVQALIDTDKYDVKILSQRWGNTRFGYLKDHGEEDLYSRLIYKLTYQPDIWIQITIPNEFEKIGKYSIGVTAGIETSLCDPSWIQGGNKMDLILVSSNHAKNVLENANFEVVDKNNPNNKQILKLNTKVEVLFEGVKLDKYYNIKSSDRTKLSDYLDSIPESFCYLTMGHWMQGKLGEDRKNIGYTIKTFLETFKNKTNRPALILKSHTSTTSILDRERMLTKIDEVRKTVKGALPNIYLIHGEVDDAEINELYNHPKVKTFVSLTKGEGFGRPFLEFSVIGKPIIASNWSGHTDFLRAENVRFVGGTLDKVHKSASVKNLILEEASWFRPDDTDVARAYKEVQKKYKKYLVMAKKQSSYVKRNFTYEKMVETLSNFMTQYVPDFPKQVDLNIPKLNLPKLKKLGGETEPKVTLPKLQKLS